LVVAAWRVRLRHDAARAALGLTCLAIVTINLWNHLDVARQVAAGDNRLPAEGTRHDVHRTGARRAHHRPAQGAGRCRVRTHPPRLVLVTLAALLALALGACGTDEGSTAAPAADDGGPP
jgi:hypothetical protein